MSVSSVQMVQGGGGVKKTEVYRMVHEEERRTQTSSVTTGRSADPKQTFQSQSFIQMQKNVNDSKQKQIQHKEEEEEEEEEEEDEEEEEEEETETETESEDEAQATPPPRKPGPAAQQQQPIRAQAPSPTAPRGGVQVMPTATPPQRPQQPRPPQPQQFQQQQRPQQPWQQQRPQSPQQPWQQQQRPQSPQQQQQQQQQQPWQQQPQSRQWEVQQRPQSPQQQQRPQQPQQQQQQQRPQQPQQQQQQQPRQWEVQQQNGRSESPKWQPQAQPKNQFMGLLKPSEEEKKMYEQERLRREQERMRQQQDGGGDNRYGAISPVSPLPHDMTQTSFRKPVWPPSNNRQYLPTSTQSIHWTTSKGSTKFVWPPPKQYTSYDYETYENQDGPLSRGEAELKAQQFLAQPQSGARRVNPRSPGRLAAEAWEPYLGKYEENVYNPYYLNPRKTKRFEDVITCSNATRLPPTYRTPPGTQHVQVSY